MPSVRANVLIGQMALGFGLLRIDFERPLKTTKYFHKLNI